MMKKRMFLLIGVLVLVLLGSGVVSAACDYTCNGVCSTKTGKTIWDIIPCSVAEDPDCPNPALAECCGNNVCDAEENFLTCPEDCEDARRNIGSQAYGGVATASSQFPGYPYTYANDGSPLSYWAMWREDAEKYLRITLDKKSWIDHIHITSRLEYDSPVSEWTIEFSDGSIIESEKTFSLANPIDLTFEPKYVDWVQMNFIEHGLTPGVSEFEIYEIEDLDMYEEACIGNYGDHAWLPDYCCGDDAEDLGSVVGDSLCYYYELLNEWWWLDAGTFKFKIYTINNVDYASNSKEWFRCGIDMDAGEIMESYKQDQHPALKFLCYKQRDDYYFAECCLVDGGINVLDVGCYNDDKYPEKVRYIGEPIILLEREHTLNFKYSPIDAGYKNIPLNPGNWRDYDNLEFFFRLDNAKDYEVLLLEGPGEFTYPLEDYEIRLRQPLAAVSSYGEWKHAVIPVREMASYATANISQIVFYTDITKFELSETAETADIFIERIFLSNSDTQYCTNAEVSWTNDLDERYVPEPQSYEACNSFPTYNWTGNFCCGDDYFSEDDFYKDDIAGCWHSSVVVNNSITSDRDVLFYNGDFYGCNSEFSSLIDYDADACEALGDYFCDADGWSDEASGNVPASLRGRESSVPDDVPATQPTSCCSVNTCWNGTGCADGLENKPDRFYNLSGHIYRCVYGEWQTADLKYSWDNIEYGFCPYADQCLVSRTRDPMCVDDAGYVEDHYCDDGEWTTRTRMIALALLDTEAISTDFTLYCGHYTNALADYSYGVPSIEKYLRGGETWGYAGKSCFTDKDADCVNNFCILKYTDTGGVKTSFGVSLNKEIDDADYSFLDAIGKERDYCDDLHGNGPFFRCDARDVWYNPDSNMIIYAKDEIEISEQQTVFGQIAEFFKNIFEIIIGWVPTVPTGSAVDLSLIEDVGDYNTLYLQKQGSKEVSALMEETAEGVLITVVYDNFDFPVCDAVERLARHEPYQKTKCNLTNGRYIIYSNAPEIWQELTSKLRIE